MQYAIELISLALAVGTAAFLGKQTLLIQMLHKREKHFIVHILMDAGGWCWTRTAERQVSCMRRKYIEAVLRQEVEYFETSSSTSATFQVVSSISTDADTVQDFLSDKVVINLYSSCSLIHLVGYKKRKKKTLLFFCLLLCRYRIFCQA